MKNPPVLKPYPCAPKSAPRNTKSAQNTIAAWNPALRTARMVNGGCQDLNSAKEIAYSTFIVPKYRGRITCCLSVPRASHSAGVIVCSRGMRVRRTTKRKLQRLRLQRWEGFISLAGGGHKANGRPQKGKPAVWIRRSLSCCSYFFGTLASTAAGFESAETAPGIDDDILLPSRTR
jgi:hypothetical protein